eukprot:4816969-Prorocentrum_lima.AAC.1
MEWVQKVLHLQCKPLWIVFGSQHRKIPSSILDSKACSSLGGLAINTLFPKVGGTSGDEIS